MYIETGTFWTAITILAVTCVVLLYKVHNLEKKTDDMIKRSVNTTEMLENRIADLSDLIDKDSD